MNNSIQKRPIASLGVLVFHVLILGVFVFGGGAFFGSELSAQDSNSEKPKSLGEVENEMKEELLEFRKQQTEKRLELTKRLLEEQQHQKQILLFQQTVEALASQSERKFFIGVQCEPVEETAVTISADSSDGLSEWMEQKLVDEVFVKGGVKITFVVDGGPAYKSAMEVGDVIYRFNGQEVADNAALSELVDATGEKEVTVNLIRNGEVLKVALSPNRRRIETVEDDWNLRESWNAPMVAGSTVRGRNWQNLTNATVPSGIEFTLHINADGIRHFNFKDKDGREYSVTEKELNTLPLNLRAYAQQFSFRSAWDSYFAAKQDLSTQNRRLRIETWDESTQFSASQHYQDSISQLYNAQRFDHAKLSRKIDTLNQTVSELQKAIESLQKKDD